MPTATEKGCDSQLSSDNRSPSSNWPLSDLTVYAQAEHQAIQRGEESLTASYWRLGHALTFARRQFARGQWRQYLEELKIEKTRSSKAMAIYRTFPEVKDLAGKSVAVAYKERLRRKNSSGRGGDSNRRSNTDCPREETSDGDQDTLRSFLDNLQRDSNHWVHEAAFVEPGEATDLLPMLEVAVTSLQEVRRFLEQQAESS